MIVAPVPGGRILGTNAILVNENAAGYIGKDSVFSYSEFDISYNKSLKNPQGKLSVYLISFNNIGGGIDYDLVRIFGHWVEVPRLNTYLINSNAIAVLQTSYPTAVFSAKCNIKELVDGVWNPVEGNAKLDVTMTDWNPSFPLTDTLGITVYMNHGGLWYASNWNGASSTEQDVFSIFGIPGPDQLTVQLSIILILIIKGRRLKSPPFLSP